MVMNQHSGANHSLLLRDHEEARLNELFHTKCFQDGNMDLTNFILLAIERNMVSNKFSLDIFYTAFKEAARNGNADVDGDADNRFILTNHNFFLALYNLSKALFAHDEKPFESMFAQMLTEKMVTHDKQLVGGRSPKLLENQNNILSEDSIKVYLTYLDKLKNLFTQFVHKNLNAKKKVQSWREIEEKKIEMKVSAFLKMCRLKHMIPSHLNIETLQDFIAQKVLTPMTNEEHDYMVDKKRLLSIYNEDVNPNESQCLPEDGEPGLLFHEFIILLGLIAINCSGTSDIPHVNIENFFVETLGFDRIPEEKRKFKAFDDYLKPKASKKHLADLDADEMDEDDDFVLDDEDGASSDELCLDEKEKEFKMFLQAKAEEEANFTIDFDDVLDMLDECLPEIPGKPEVQQIRPGIPKDEKAPVRIEFGKLMPPPPGEDKKKKKAPKKAAAKLKKGEKEKKPLQFRDMPVPDPNTYTLDLCRKAANDMNENVFPMQAAGDQQNPGIMPSIIKEVFFPPDAPQEVATLIESALVYQNSANYQMAIRSLEDARSIWRRIENPPKLDIQKSVSSPGKKNAQEEEKEPRLREEQELFFEMSLGSVYESSGKDELAIACYMRAITEINLPKNHPDQAFPFCGLGSVLYHIDEPAWALRCFLNARQIREERLGGDTVDTSTVYNNLGCCMYMLERNQEAKAFLELSNAIMDAELGPDHERTLTTARNILKAQRTQLALQPEFRYLWWTWDRHPNPTGKKGKKKKGGKKKKK